MLYTCEERAKDEATLALMRWLPAWCDGTAQREGESSESCGLLSNEETKLEREKE